MPSGKGRFLLVAAGILAGCCPALALELSLKTQAGVLHGTLDLPPGTHRAPVALIIAGSGPTDRDGNQQGLKNDSLKLLGRALAERNVAALRYDKRNAGKSVSASLREEDLRFEDLVSDAADWIRLLRRDRRFRGMALIGHSEGSLVGMLAARRAEVDAFVSLDGPGRNAAVVLRQQIERQLAPDLRPAAYRILDELAVGRIVKDVPADLSLLFRVSVQPYLISWFKYDPRREIAALRVPVLIVQGTTDMQVSVADAKRLAAAGKDSRLRLIDGMNHVLRRASTTAEQQASYVDPSIPIDARAVDAIAAFLADELRPRRAGAPAGLRRGYGPEAHPPQALQQLEASGLPGR